MQTSFYNTIEASGQQLIDFEQKAQTQEELILSCFKQYNKIDLIPDEVQDLCWLSETPITSIRRAITNLTKQGKLIKTTNQRKGRYGKMTYAWKINSNSI